MDVDGDTALMTSDSSWVEELTDQLYLDDPSKHSQAPESLCQLVSPVPLYKYEFVDPAASDYSAVRRSDRETSVEPGICLIDDAQVAEAGVVQGVLDDQRPFVVDSV